MRKDYREAEEGGRHGEKAGESSVKEGRAKWRPGVKPRNQFEGQIPPFSWVS